jgi:hypothetical protein
MEFVRNNSIIIPRNSQIEQSYGSFYDKPDRYNEIKVGSGSHLSGSYTFSGVQSEKIVINQGCNIRGFGIFSRNHCRQLEIHPETKISGPYTFQYCSYLKTVRIHEGVRITGNYTFSCCSMTELILVEGIRLLGTGTFYSCDGLEHLDIPDGAFFDGIFTFAKCKNLKSIRFGNNVMVYGHSIFSSCTSLESIHFGDNVSIYGENNFCGCSNITTIEYGENFINEDKTLRIIEKPYKRVRFEEIPEGVECSIRMESFDENSVIAQTTCGHYFNEDGLCQWFERNDTCPMCRKNLEC